MKTFVPALPSARTPSWGVGWWPVMAVVALSRMTRMKRAPWKTALMRPGIPAWKKVESPIVTTIVGKSFPPAAGVVETRPLADAGAHAMAGVHGAEVHPQRVAADVAGENSLGKGLADRIEGRPVAASRAERRADPLLRRGCGQNRGKAEKLPKDAIDDVGRQLPLPGNVAGAPAADPAVGELHLDHAVRLLQDEDLLVAPPDLLDEGFVERVGEANLVEVESAPRPQGIEQFGRGRRRRRRRR